jgi:MFS family permease
MVMIVSDLARVAIAIGFLFVRGPETLWIAYLCTALLSVFGSFFEAAKQAAMPNITGERDLLAGNALMFSSRFLLMSLGAALGGWTAANVGYSAAFIVNAVSFLGSALSVWIIPEHETREAPLEMSREAKYKKPSYWSDMREGWSYVLRNRPVAALLLINIIWATGGGAGNLIYDRLGGIVFAGQRGISGDIAVAALYFAGGVGLTVGMMIARRVGIYVEFTGKITGLIGWGLITQGLLFALMGVMPGLWWACLLLLLGRTVLGAEFGVQDALLMRLAPDKLRGRVLATDRASEILTWSLSTAVAGWSLRAITPRTLTVIAGLLSATSGAVWLLLFASGKVTLPEKFRSPTAELKESKK